jgi:hypothetical protein
MEAFKLLCQAGERFMSHLREERQQGSKPATSSVELKQAVMIDLEKCEAGKTRLTSNSEERDSGNERDRVSESSTEGLGPVLASRTGEVIEATSGRPQVWPEELLGRVDGDLVGVLMPKGICQLRTRTGNRFQHTVVTRRLH